MAGADPETESSAEQENLAPESSRSNNDGTKKSRLVMGLFICTHYRKKSKSSKNLELV